MQRSGQHTLAAKKIKNIKIVPFFRCARMLQETAASICRNRHGHNSSNPWQLHRLSGILWWSWKLFASFAMTCRWNLNLLLIRRSWKWAKYNPELRKTLYKPRTKLWRLHSIQDWRLNFHEAIARCVLPLNLFSTKKECWNPRSYIRICLLG